jgi:uncharacterized protein
MSVFHRQLREKKWTRGQFQIVVRQFTQDVLAGLWTWLPLDPTILTDVAQTYVLLPDTVWLRAADCIHLITAIRRGFGEIFTYDVRQAQAASALRIQPMRA